MSAMKATDSDVDHRGTQARTIVFRHGDPVPESRERGVAERRAELVGVRY
jgi:hypothetical protein